MRQQICSKKFASGDWVAYESVDLLQDRKGFTKLVEWDLVGTVAQGIRRIRMGFHEDSIAPGSNSGAGENRGKRMVRVGPDPE